MPTYDYQCDGCGHRWELFQSIKADPERTCPKCHKKKARRLVGMGAGILVSGRTRAPEPAAGTPSSEAAPKSAANTPPNSAAKPGTPSTPGTPSAPGTPHASGTPTAPGTHAASQAATQAAASSASQPSTPSEPTASKATHPAREGRGYGNIRDAIQRQRRAGEHSKPAAPAKKPKSTPKRGGR